MVSPWGFDILEMLVSQRLGDGVVAQKLLMFWVCLSCVGIERKLGVNTPFAWAES